MKGRKCSVCGQKKSVLDFPRPIEDEITICSECNKYKSIKKYLKNNKKKWNNYYSEYRKKYFSEDEPKFRQKISAILSRLKKINDPEMMDFLEKNKKCIHCEKIIKENNQKMMILNPKFFEENKDLTKSYYFNEIKGYLDVSHHWCMLSSRKYKKSTKVKTNEIYDYLTTSDTSNSENDVVINLVSLTYLYFISNTRVKNEKLGNILLPFDDPLLHCGIIRSKTKDNGNDFFYYRTNKFTQNLLIDFFDISVDNVWDKKKKILDSVFNYLQDKTNDTLFADSVMYLFRMSLDKLCIKFHLKELEKKNLNFS